MPFSNKVDIVNEDERFSNMQPGKSTLDIAEFQPYYDAIRKDDIVKIKKLLESPDTDKSAMINSAFDLRLGNKELKRSDLNYHLSLPLHIAVSSGCLQVAQYFLDNGADACLKDKHGYTLFHSIIAIARALKMEESKAVEIFHWLVRNLEPEVTRKLLLSENHRGLRPVEYAAKRGMLLLLDRIMSTKGVYVIKEDIKGSTSYMWHDVTEYSNGERVTKSPLLFIPGLSVSRLNDNTAERLLQSKLLRGWGKATMHSNIILIIIWFILRVLYFVLFFSLYADTRELAESEESDERAAALLNITDFESRICSDLDHRFDDDLFDALFYTMLVAGCTFVVFDIWDTVRGRMNGYTLNIKPSKNAIVDHWFFRFVQLSINITIVSFAPLVEDNAIRRSVDYNTYVVFMRCLMPLLCSWSVLYFALLLPSIGVAVNSIQNMLKDMAHFGFLYGVFLIPFQQVFQYFLLNFSKTGCQDDFQNDRATTFTLLLMMFNIVDPREYDVENVDLFRLLFVLYTFMCAIILLNFLIAIMTNTAYKTNAQNKIILQLNQLSVACLIENRFSFLNCYYSQMRKLFFTVEDDRIYIVTANDRFQTQNAHDVICEDAVDSESVSTCQED